MFIILYFESIIRINITVETSERYSGKTKWSKTKKPGWDESKIIGEHTITDGKIIDAQGNRNTDRVADYVLLHGGMIVAIVEAKMKTKIP